MKKQKFNRKRKLPGCIGWGKQHGKTGDSAA